MPTLTIDGLEVSVESGATIMVAARRLGVKIPHLCYHSALSVAGSCRMCMVEVDKVPRPVVACAMPVNDGMVVRTRSEMVLKARRGVMELLLINHPLDCPVCDQGGECKLQDLAVEYGPDRSRYREEKRQVPNYDLGPLIETEMNRCIHCTRCVRFSTEIAGVEEMGAVFRGDHMRVGPYVERLALTSELSGNMAEICPVGALNSKPFHFQARGWELARTPGICLHCAVGCQTTVQHLDNRVRRVGARRCGEINQAWLCDKGRFAYDGLGVGRLVEPSVRSGDGRQAAVSWQEAMDRAGEILRSVKPEEVAGLVDPSSQGAEELFAFQDFIRNVVGSAHLDHRIRQRDFSGDDVALTRSDLMMNTTLEQLGRADAVFLVGFDPRFEVPLLNLRLRQASQGGAVVRALNPRRLHANLGNLVETVVPPGGEVGFLRSVLAVLAGEAVVGEVTDWATALRSAKMPVLLLGNYAILHPQAEAIRRCAVEMLNQVGAVGGGWNGFNRVVSFGNAAAAQDCGLVPHRGPGYRRLERSGKNADLILRGAASGEIKVLFLLGGDLALDAADTVLAREALSKARVIYMGAFRTAVAEAAEVVFPGLVHGEKESTVTSCEGRVQRSARAVNGPLLAKEDWRVLRALSDRLVGSRPLPYDTLAGLREAMGAAYPCYRVSQDGRSEFPFPCDQSSVTTGLELGFGASGVQPSLGMLTLVVEQAFYCDDAVTRRSATMAMLDRGGRLQVNPEDAQTYKIKPGGRAKLVGGGRSVELGVDVDANVPCGVVFGRFGYGPDVVQDLCTGGGPFPQVSLVGL
ncbi:MAG: NADH-quinone oxidoreductase subunit NuoG [Magnetococcus sp. XQGC-1]